MAVRLGELLLREKRITPVQLQEALNHQRQHGGRLSTSLVSLGILTEDDITTVVSRHCGVPAINLREFDLDPAIVRLVPAESATKYNVLPVGRSGTTLTLAMADPTNVFAMDDVKFMTGLHVEPVVASESAIREAIARYYGNGRQGIEAGPSVKAADLATRALEELGTHDDNIEVVADAEEIDAATLEKQGGEAPIIKLVNALMLSAIQKGASDIHIEPYEKDMRIRFRIDGQLQTVMTPAIKFRDPIISRVKIMARLDIAEKRLPQDGRIKARFVDRGRTRDIDFRVSVLPTLFGEKVVLRLLDPEGLKLDMTKLGFEPDALDRFMRAIRKPWGMVLVTGPTGSGKTNTLYSSLAQINDPHVNIMTAEDPVEFNLAGVNQVPVRENIGLTFAAVLRSFLRQDPNVILVGEIRDSETASIAVKAALTGHLVLSTLHTNDAPSSINRLVNMGIESFLVASSVNLIAAQRLVRRICTNCREPASVSVAELVEAGFPPEQAAGVQAMRGRGCDRCNGSGYKGRVGVFEVMEISDRLRELIVTGAPTAELKQVAMEEGMLTLRQSGLEKVRQGVTSLEEVVRETM
ncbi:MAG: type IV-A pilus assembly ATPase PilB [Acidobacteriota bacterium]|jgi:type IV pilus assembly protein PilB|nr:MAG: type IV-A pilus assembly ATPase PilB [Acidobacteriota bacterium]